MFWTLVSEGGEGSGTKFFLVMPNLRSKIFLWLGGGAGVSSSFSTHACQIHTHTIQIRIVALCVSKSATKKEDNEDILPKKEEILEKEELDTLAPLVRRSD